MCGQPVYANGKIIGKTTSAAFGYRVGKPVALASILIDAGLDVKINIGGEKFSGRVSASPVFDPDGNRMKVR